MTTLSERCGAGPLLRTITKWQWHLSMAAAVLTMMTPIGIAAAGPTNASCGGIRDLKGFLATPLVGGQAASDIACDLDQTLYAGNGKSENKSSFVRKVTVWRTDLSLAGVQLELFNGRVILRGCASGCNSSSEASYIFSPGEVISSLSVWDTSDNLHCGGIQLTTSSGFQLRAVSEAAHDEHVLDVGSGIIAGMYGKYSSSGIDALGFLFVPQVSEPYYISHVKLAPSTSIAGTIAAQLAAPVYTVSQLCSGTGPVEGKAFSCQSTAAQTWTSQHMLSVNETFGINSRADVTGTISFGAFKMASSVTALVKSAPGHLDTVATITSTSVGYTGLITPPAGKTIVSSATVRLVRLSGIPWTGRLNFRTASGPVLSVTVEGTYSLLLVTRGCSEQAVLGTPAARCKCGSSCGEQVSATLQLPSSSQDLEAPYSPPYLLTAPISETQKAAMQPMGLAGVEVLGPASATFPWGDSSIDPSMFPDTKAQWIWSTFNAQSFASTSDFPVFLKVISVASATIARLHLLVDDYAEVFLNGVLVGAAAHGWEGDYDPSSALTLQLRQGANTLAIRGTNYEGGAGLLACVVSMPVGKPGSVLARSDASWKVTYAMPQYIHGASPLEASSPGAPGVLSNFPDLQAKWIRTSAVSTYPDQSSQPSQAAADDDKQLATFFSAPANGNTIPITARLHVAVDGVADVFLNGVFQRFVRNGRQGSAYTGQPMWLTLQPGANLISIRCRRVGGSSGALLASLTAEDDSWVMLRTDESWLYTLDRLPDASVMSAAPMDATIGQEGGFPDNRAAWVQTEETVPGAFGADSAAYIYWKTITLSAAQNATLYVIPMAYANAYVNSQRVGFFSFPDYGKMPVTVALQAGSNTIELRTTNFMGKAPVMATLVASDGRTVLARTDGSWTVTTELPPLSDY